MPGFSTKYEKINAAFIAHILNKVDAKDIEDPRGGGGGGVIEKIIWKPQNAFVRGKQIFKFVPVTNE